MKRQQGSVFIVTLAILTTMVAILASIAATQNLVVRERANRMSARRTRFVALSAMQRAITSLVATVPTTSSSTTTTTTTSTTNGAVTQADEWYTLGTNGDEQFVLGRSTYRMQIIDACSLVDINTADETQLGKLPLTQEQLDSLLDYRSTTSTEHSDGGKDTYYNALTNAYNAKLRRLDTVDELLQIRGFTPTDIYNLTSNTTATQSLSNLADGRQPALIDLITVDGFSSTKNSDGNQKVALSSITAAGGVQVLTRIGISPATATQIVAALPTGGRFTTLRQLLNAAGNLNQNELTGILDGLVAASGTRVEGKINLNTASQSVLESVTNLTTDQASSIVSYQSTGFAKLSDILKVSGLNTASAIAPVIDSFTVSSTSFLVRVVVEVGTSQVAYIGVIDTSSGTPQLIRMEEQPFSNMISRWGWNDTTTTVTTIKEATS